MDLFKLRKDGSSSEAEAAKSLERLLTNPAPSAADTSSKPASTLSSASTVAGVTLGTPNWDIATMRAESVISEGFQFNGIVRAQTDLRVDGTLDGDVDVRALLIGPTGSVIGQCRCDTLFIDGRFQGKAECRELHLHASAVVDGDVTYSVLRVQRGAKVTGKYVQKKREAP